MYCVFCVFILLVNALHFVTFALLVLVILGTILFDQFIVVAVVCIYKSLMLQVRTSLTCNLI